MLKNRGTARRSPIAVSDMESEIDDEAESFRRLRETGDLRMRDALFAKYSGVVEAVLRGHLQKGSDIEDLRQVGYLGLITALERFDPERGVRFSTYATHRVEGAIRHYLRDKTELVRRPRWMRKLSSQIAAYLEDFQQAHRRLPTLTEISEALNISPEGVVAILSSRKPISLDDDEGYKGLPSDPSLIRSLRHESFQLPIEDRIAISQAFEKLLEVEQKIVYLFFVKDLTQRQIASRLELSPRKVSRLMSTALQGLKRGLLGEPSQENRP